MEIQFWLIGDSMLSVFWCFLVSFDTRKITTNGEQKGLRALYTATQNWGNSCYQRILLRFNQKIQTIDLSVDPGGSTPASSCSAPMCGPPISWPSGSSRAIPCPCARGACWSGLTWLLFWLLLLMLYRLWTMRWTAGFNYFLHPGISEIFPTNIPSGKQTPSSSWYWTCSMKVIGYVLFVTKITALCAEKKIICIGVQCIIVLFDISLHLVSFWLNWPACYYCTCFSRTFMGYCWAKKTSKSCNTEQFAEWDCIWGTRFRAPVAM